MEGAKRQEKRQRLSQDYDDLPTQIPANPVSSSKQSSSTSQPQSQSPSQPPSRPPSQPPSRPLSQPSSRPASESPTLPSGDCERSERKSSGDSNSLFPADNPSHQPLGGPKTSDDSMDNGSADQTQINKTLFGRDSLLDDSFDISVNQSSSEISLNQSSSSYASSTATLVPDDESRLDELKTEKSRPDISVLKYKCIPPPKNEIIDILLERPLHEYYFCEIDLLKRFAEFIAEEDPDIILVWNRDKSIGTGPFLPSFVPVLFLVLFLEVLQDVGNGYHPRMSFRVSESEINPTIKII